VRTGRGGAGLALLATLTATWVGSTPAVAQDASGPPDIVLIVTDDQRWDTLWAMPVVQEELVARGVSFPNAFVVNAICCPSRASILTGDHSHTTMVYRQAPPFGRFEWFDDSRTIATELDGAGYTTGLFGKYLDGYQHAALTGVVPPGWDRWVAFVRSGYTDYKLTVDGEVRTYGSSAAERSTEVLAAEAVDFIDRTEGPIFLEFAPAAPHAPATPAPGDERAFEDLDPARPPSFDEADVEDKPAWVEALAALTETDRARIDAFRLDQYRSLLAVDRAVGAILGALERTGRLEDTLILYTSDNGILHGEHRWTKKEAPYEESIRVPLVVRWDAAGWSTPARPSALALNIDLTPTIADAAGVLLEADGRSLLPVLAGEPVDWREDFLIEHLENVNPIPTYCAVRTREAKYVWYATGEEEVYDLAADPYELENLIDVPAATDLLDGLRARLRELCVPPPPGLNGSGAGRVAIAIALLGALVLAEAWAIRRRTPGASSSRR
jgi:arylsulfatase A-like enzyme